MVREEGPRSDLLGLGLLGMKLFTGRSGNYSSLVCCDGLGYSVLRGGCLSRHLKEVANQPWMLIYEAQRTWMVIEELDLEALGSAADRRWLAARRRNGSWKFRDSMKLS